jgi:hypothetical protein
MADDPKNELPPESFGERGGTATKEEPTVDQQLADPQPGITNRPIEEELENQDELPARGDRKNEGVGATETR